MSIGKLLIDDQPLQVLPTLAEAIGLNEALILQQVHWLLLRSKKEFKGKSWVYNTYEEWQEKHFRFFSVSTIRRTISNLENLGLLISTTEFNQMKVDKTKWYTINYEALDRLAITTAKNDSPSVQNEQSSCSNWSTPSVQNEQTNNQENTQEIPTRDIKKTTQKSEAEILLEQFGVTGQLAKDFIAHRKAKKGVISETQMNRLQKQADKAGISICEAISICIERNWQGFNATWDWRDEKLRPLNTSSKMSFEEKNALPWNRPEDWVGVL